jgi:signal transduction histidine kinase
VSGPYKFLLPVFLFLVLSATGQDRKYIDSLLTQLGKQSADSVRCRLMLEIATEYRTKDTLSASEFLEQGRQIAEKMGYTNLLGRYYEIRGEMHTHFGLYDQAMMEYDRALSLYYEVHNDVGYYETLKDKGNVHLFKSEYPQALNDYETALDFYRRKGIPRGTSRCLNNIGIIYKNRGQYVEALTAFDESISYIDGKEEPMELAQGYINMGNVFVYLGSYEQALEYYQMAQNIAESEGSPKELALCLQNSGVIQNKCGNYTEADQFYRRALTLGREVGDPVVISNCLINIGTNLSDMGQHEEGLRYVEQGLEIKTQLGDDRTISNCNIYMAEIYYAMGDDEKASGLFKDAIPTKETLGDQEGLVRCYLGLARIHADRGNEQQAKLESDRALEIAENIGALEHIAAVYSLKQEQAEARGDYRSAYQYATNLSRINDSLLDENTSKAVMEMEFRHRAKVLEKENENLRIQSGLTSELMKKRNAFLYSIAGIAVLLAAGLVLGAYALRRLRMTSLKLEEKNLVITKQNLKLDTLNRTKDRMMSIIAHDLRGTIGNQLTAIEVLNRMEATGHKGIDRKKLLGNLKHAATYSLELLENLLHWSRLEENKTYYHPEEINLERVVSGCVSIFDETARKKDISVEQRIKDPTMLHADRIMLEAIVRNLLSNAIKFSKSGGHILLSAREEDSYIQFEVRDEGIGMTPEQIDKVVNNGGYTQRGTANEKGAGIGITLVREFTSLHRGRFSIESEPGKGTRVVIDLPKQL